jgi:hypothetical protein
MERSKYRRLFLSGAVLSTVCIFSASAFASYSSLAPQESTPMTTNTSPAAATSDTAAPATTTTTTTTTATAPSAPVHVHKRIHHKPRYDRAHTYHHHYYKGTPYVAAPVARAPFIQFKRYELGVMLGATGTRRRAAISSLPTNTSASAGLSFTQTGSKADAEVGFQARSIFDITNIAQLFFYLNGSSTLGSLTSINFGAINPPSILTTNLAVYNNYVVRAGAGIQTEPLWNVMQIGLGAGVAFVNQTIKPEIGEAVTTGFENNLTLIEPTVMGTLGFTLCPYCVGGHPASLAAMVSADRYPGMKSNGITDGGNTYQSSINQKWVVHGDLILSVGLP